MLLWRMHCSYVGGALNNLYCFFVILLALEEPLLLQWNRHTVFINARRACARGLQYSVCLSVCLSVCYQSPAFFSRLYDKLYLPACSSLDFLDFQLSEFDETVSFGR